ncbi:MAG: VWA domain-containing protein [Chitinophagaceae bacterium]|nr:VWA domain-containing protein [Chitinophagaceae bacterium]
MKLIRILAALLLIVIFYACNEGQKTGKVDQRSSPQAIVIQPIETKAPQPPPADSYSVDKRAELENVKIGSITQEGIADESIAYSPKLKQEDRGYNTEDYDHIVDNTFLAAMKNPLSTFSIDVDEASYSNVRRYIESGTMPPAGAVRIEEMINYFDYEYPQPTDEHPFKVITEVAACPWNTQHQLVHIGMQGKIIPMENLPASNMVFLIDVSGSMNDANKLPLVKASLKMLVEKLRPIDKVAIVVYAGSAGLVLPSTNGNEKATIRQAIDNLEAGGSTAGGEGILLAYKTAHQGFIKGGNNRIVLATDGDFNVGPSSDDDLVNIVEKERTGGVFLSVLGYGMGNYKDNKMQQLADKGNGNHSYIDNINEARKVLVSEFGSTLFTIAKDVKLQVEFNPAKVAAYRLIGYENRVMANEDFNDDKKDAGELGSGHTVTALYEIIPVGVKSDFIKSVDPLKYQSNPPSVVNSDELMTIKLRYKKPDSDKSQLLSQTVAGSSNSFSNSSNNFRFSAAVASFGMLLRNSSIKVKSEYAEVRKCEWEFIRLVQSAGTSAGAEFQLWCGGGEGKFFPRQRRRNTCHIRRDAPRLCAEESSRVSDALK